MQCTRLIQSWEKKDNTRVHLKSFKAMYSLSISLFKSFTLYQAVCLDCRTPACLKTKYLYFMVLFSGLTGRCKTGQPTIFPPLPTDLCNLQECTSETTEKKFAV